MCSNRTISPASFAGSRSCGVLVLLGERKISLSLGIIFSVKGRPGKSSNSIILKTFKSIRDNKSRSNKPVSKISDTVSSSQNNAGGCSTHLSFPPIMPGEPSSLALIWGKKAILSRVH
jgi:hypothetical protein